MSKEVLFSIITSGVAAVIIGAFLAVSIPNYYLKKDYYAKQYNLARVCIQNNGSWLLGYDSNNQCLILTIK